MAVVAGVGKLYDNFLKFRDILKFLRNFDKILGIFIDRLNYSEIGAL